MSTLGGTRGERERNPKPKFAALDINSLYRSSRGETSEPATLKNAAPRKHGMQSLGKVPSARRPPANLPSIKAETSTPISVPAQLSNDQPATNNSSVSWADSSNGPTPGQQSTISSNSDHQTSQLNQSGSLNQTLSGASASSGASWSTIATGGNVKEESLSQPPLYQSSQFQNEFPSLDGTISLSSLANVNAMATGMQKQQNQNYDSNDSDGVSSMNLRPSTDAASWHQQQINSGNVRGAVAESGQLPTGSYQQELNNVPPKFIALLPAFMRGTTATTGTGNSSSLPAKSSNQSNQNLNYGSNCGMNYQNQARGSGRGSSYYSGSSYTDYGNSHSNTVPPRLQQRQQNAVSSRRQNDNSERNSYEPELIVQRPIIKEEELDRIDSLARDDAWGKHDEIDYNKKLQFSDDETDEMKPKESDAWRDSDKKDLMQHNGNRSIDQALVEKMKQRREEEEKLERERKIAAQKKLQELEVKTMQKYSTDKLQEKDSDDKLTQASDSSAERKTEQRSNDYGKSTKYIDKYDSYDFGQQQQRGGSGSREQIGDFKKSAFQSNLPPRFQKQQHFDRHDERRDKPLPPGYKSLHQQDSKNVPFAQQSFEQQRWNYSNKQQSQQQTHSLARRNVSSLSQSSSDDNRRDGSKSYGRKRLESEEDDYRYVIKQDQSTKKASPVAAQITRSMSDSSDKLSDHNRSEKSTSREYLSSTVCWADVCESDKKSVETKRRVSESSAMSDDQPRTILQRSKPLHEQLQAKEKHDMKEPSDGGENKSVLNESQQKIESTNDDKKSDASLKLNDSNANAPIESKKSLESIPEKDQNTIDKVEISTESKDSSKDSVTQKESDDNRHGANKKLSPRTNRYENTRDPRTGQAPRGNYSYYRGGNNWNRRQPGQHQHIRNELSDSENSDEYEWNRHGPKSGARKEINRDGRGYCNLTGSQKEGFSPRGEPSRRGRGALSHQQSSSFRRSGSSGAITAPVKRIDNYGPPSSKSPFGSNDEKSIDKKEGFKEKVVGDDDRTKQKQKALSEGLLNKNQKDVPNSNVTQKDLSITSSSSPSGNIEEKQQCNEDFQPSLISESRERKSSEIDDKVSGRSNASFSHQNRQKTNPQMKTAPNNKAPISMPPVTSSQYSGSSANSHASVDTRNSINSKTYSVSEQRSVDLRNNNRMAPRFAKQQRDNLSGPPPSTANMNRMSGNYWDKNSVEQSPHGVVDEKMAIMQLNTSNVSSSSNSSLNNSNMISTKNDGGKQQQPNSMQISQNQLDGASLPKTTLIFENTSYKTGPPPSLKRPMPSSSSSMNQIIQKPQDTPMGTINDMIDQQKQQEQSLSNAFQNLSFSQKTQNDMVDMNFQFTFDTQIGHLADDTNNKSGFGSNTVNTHPSQMHQVSKAPTSTSASSLGLVGAKTGIQQTNILNTDALNMKVASCKKVWEEPSVTMEHGTADDAMANFIAQQQYGHNSMPVHHSGLNSGPQSYVGYNPNATSNDHNSSLEHFNKSNNDGDDSNSYTSPGQQHMNSHIIHSQNQQANMKAAEAFATNANVCKVKPTQQQMHQAGLSPPPQMQQNQLQQQQNYYPTPPNYQNMPAIPSPPAVVYNSQAGGLYNPYNIDAARAQLYAGYAGAANNSMSFNAFMQTPNLASAPTHEMYQNLSQYRATVQPFNQTPQLSNPNTVLISSATSMSTKSNAPQQIGAIGSKSTGQGGPSATGQYGQQPYMNMYHQHQNSYYTNSTAQQANTYYSAPTGTTGSTAGNYGMFGGHGGHTTSNGPPPQPQQMPSFGSVGQFPLGSQMLNNLVINQYRGGPVVNPGANSGNANAGSNANPPGGYMKQQQQHQSQMQDPTLSNASCRNDMSPPQKVFNSSNVGNWDNLSVAPLNSPNYRNQGIYQQWTNQTHQSPTPIQRPNLNNSCATSASHYQTQRAPSRTQLVTNLSHSMMNVGKSHYNLGNRFKAEVERSIKPQMHLSKTDMPNKPE